jgi:pimeloyl-ACP methyl ester carboxylesterase
MGVGAVSYLRFIDCLTAAFPARALLLIEMDYICMRLPLRAHVPSPEATVAGLRGVLAAVGAESAHWMGHSFGTIVLSWLLRLAPPRCLAACTFVDPIPFLLFKSNVAVHFVYRPPSSAVDRLVRYFVAEELGISTMLHRHFSWTHNLLDPRLLDGVPTAVVLSERDAYVPSAAIARHLAHRAPEVLVVTLEGYLHSEFCFSAQGPARVAAAVVDADGRRRPPTAADGRQRVKSPAAARRSSGRRATSPAGGAK